MTEQSESPYTVSPSVLGIGVAVMMRISALIPFFFSAARCRTPEAVLLIDDRKPEIPERYLFLDYGMGADNNVNPAPGNVIIDIPLL